MKKYIILGLCFLAVNVFALESKVSNALPKSGGTLTGALSGTSASFTGLISTPGMYQTTIATQSAPTAGDYYEVFKATIPANTITADGQGFELVWAGKAINNRNVAPRVSFVNHYASNYVGGIFASAGTGWVVKWTVIRNQTGGAIAIGECAVTDASKTVQVNFPVVDWTVDQPIKFDFYTATATADITSHYWNIRYIK